MYVESLMLELCWTSGEVIDLHHRHRHFPQSCPRSDVGCTIWLSIGGNATLEIKDSTLHTTCVQRPVKNVKHYSTDLEVFPL